MKIEIYNDKATEYRWRMVARNGKVVADSAEGYTTKQGCEHAIARFKDEVANAEIIDLTRQRKIY